MLNEVLKEMKVYQTTQTTGCGPVILAAQSGNRSFYSAFGAGKDNDGADVFLYLIRHRAADEWEVGTGHLSDAATLVRDTVVASSNNDLTVNFSAGVKDITNNIYEGPYDA
jgi:hypothetical protein